MKVLVEIEQVINDYQVKNIGVGQLDGHARRGLIEQIRKALERTNPVNLINLDLTPQEIIAIEQTLAYCKDQEGLSQQGYFSCGWAGKQLQSILDKAQAVKDEQMKGQHAH